MNTAEQSQNNTNHLNECLPLVAAEASVLSGGGTKLPFASPLPPIPPLGSEAAGRLGNAQAIAKELYLDAVGAEAVARVGRGPQLKGVIQELMFCDKRNLSLKARLRGETTMLTRNPTAHTVDVVTMRKGKIVAR